MTPQNSNSVVAGPVARSHIETPPSLSKLSRREVEVLSLIAKGLTTEEIAAQLHRSVPTVKSHRQKIGRKLGVRSRVALARVAIAAGLSPVETDTSVGRSGPAPKLLTWSISSLPFPFAVVASDGAIHCATPAFGATIGYVDGGFVGRHIDDFVRRPGEARSVTWLLDAVSRAPHGVRVELFGPSKVGFDATAIPVRDDSGVVVGATIVLGARHATFDRPIASEAIA
jgi:DNA-binding CsgD family transcriptional regulator